jgi:hypothetical protein
MEIMMAAQVVGAVVGAAGTIMGGNAAAQAGKAEAKMYRAAAESERAISHRDAEKERRKGDLIGSTAQARLASSGGTATDATAADIAGSIAEETEYNALMALSDGETRARQLEYGGALKKFEGQQARRASRWAAGATLMGTGASMASKYGGGGPGAVFGAKTGSEGSLSSYAGVYGG